MVYHPDVAKQTLVAREVYHGTLDIRALFGDDYTKTLYPYGTAVMLGKAAKLFGGRLDEVHRWQWALRMRYVSVTLILLSAMMLLTALSKTLRPPYVLLAGMVLLSEPLNSQFSHYGMNDVPLAAFMLLTMAGSMLMPSEKRFPAWSLISGLAAGAGFAVKYQGLLALAFPGLVWLWDLRKRPASSSIASAAAVAAGFFASSLALCPLLVKDPGYFFGTFGQFMSWQANIMELDATLAEKLGRNIPAAGRIFIMRGYVLALPLAAVALVQVWRSRKRTEIAAPALAALIVSIILMAAILGSRDIVRQNDLIPVIACLLCQPLAMIEEMGARARTAATAILIVLASGFTVVSALDAAALRREDTRLTARDWCDSNLPGNLVVAYERYALPPTRGDLRVVSSKYLGDSASRRLIMDGAADVFITSSLAYQRFFDPYSPYFDRDTQAAYARLNETYRVAARFSDRPLLYAQPEITVYMRRDSDDK